MADGVGTIGEGIGHVTATRSEAQVASGAKKIAIAGLGLVGQRHATAIAEIGTAELAAIVDPSQEAAAFAGARGIAYYVSLEEMLARAEPDGVVLSTPTGLHVQQGLACIAAGVPVLIEKPLADDLTEAAALVEASTRAGVPVLVGHHRRHNPLIGQAHALIARGEIGEVRAVNATCWFYKPDDYFEVAPWRKRKGAGPILVNLVHDIDLIRYLCGEVRAVQAQATPARRGYENEDVAAAVLSFENGAIGTITVSDSIVAPWSWEMTSGEYPIYPKTSQSSYLIGGSHGSLSVPDLKVWTHAQERDWWTPISATAMPHDASDPLVNQMAHFAEVIAGETEPLVSGAEGLRTLEVVAAIQKAATTGETVRLAE